MQPGKNSDNAAFSCGSGVFYRRSALKSIGGFQTWNMVEDVYTTYVLHQKGYTSLYINKSYATGLAPMDLPIIYKQRGIWALDTSRLFFRKNPFLQKGLSIRQRLHYFETGWAYLFPALTLPVLLLLLPFSIFYEVDLISQNMLYPLLKGPALMMTLFFFWRQSNRRWSEIQFWIALFPVYLKALILSLLPGKPKYRVTSKIISGKRIHFWQILPHLAFLTINIAALYWYIVFLDYGFNFSAIMACIWVGLMLFWFWPLLMKGLGFRHSNSQELMKYQERPEQPQDKLKVDTSING
jgi:cellulose synthase (UDP-forming)